ncbi:MAG: FkbM family methyltransferase [Opitutaceae bacterium]|jgi:FkbM family methyltransferase
MHAAEDFIFHLDLPREQPEARPVELLGWIAAQHPIGRVRLGGAAARDLESIPRPDVQAAYPGHSSIAGFRGLATAADLAEGSLHFSFSVGVRGRAVVEALPPRPEPARGWLRGALLLRAALARLRCRGSRSERVRWNSGLKLLLAEIRLERGDSFARPECDRVLELFARTFPNAAVLQIGANDGATGDPLARWFGETQWSGVLVEPIPHLAAALARRYTARENIAVERSAIGESDGEARMFRIADSPGAPSWHQQLASFDRSVLLKHTGAIPGLDSLVVEEAVPVISVKTLLSRHRMSRIDLLVIDTEGHDFRILRQFDLIALAPVLVMFEHQHLSPADKSAAYSLLRRAGYSWREVPEGDTLAWRWV